MTRSYAVILEPESDGAAYNVVVPAFPEAHTWGTTVEEALSMAREVIELCIQERAASGEPIPDPDGNRVQLQAVTVVTSAA